MTVILDNNLPWRMVKSLQAVLPDCRVLHVSDMGMSSCEDKEIKRRLAAEPVVWITRDEDFWLDAPVGWAVVWVDCHNPRLVFLRESLVPAIAQHIPSLGRGSRLWVTEDMVSLV